MFTGIVEEMGEVAALERRAGALRLEVACNKALEGTAIGDSIAVNGVCLTVVELPEGRFAVEAVPETLRRTNLETLAVGGRVNLERPAREGSFFGGHYVQGHINGTIAVLDVVPDGEALTLRFEIDPALAKHVVAKGYVCVDGASLTVVEAGERHFTVTLVPHTRAHIVLGGAGPGYTANLEVDVMSKYVERIAGARIEALERRIAELESRRR